MHSEAQSTTGRRPRIRPMLPPPPGILSNRDRRNGRANSKNSGARGSTRHGRPIPALRDLELNSASRPATWDIG